MSIAILAAIYVFVATVLAALGVTSLFPQLIAPSEEVDARAAIVALPTAFAGVALLTTTTMYLGMSVGQRLSNASQYLADQIEHNIWEECRAYLRYGETVEGVVLTERVSAPRRGTTTYRIHFDFDRYSKNAQALPSLLKSRAPKLLRFPVVAFLVGAMAYTVALTLLGIAGIAVLVGLGVVTLTVQEGAVIVLDAVQRGGLLDLYESFDIAESYRGPSPYALDVLEFALRALSSVLLFSFVVSGFRLLLAGRRLTKEFDVEHLTSSGLACHTLTAMKFYERYEELSRYLRRADASGLPEARLEQERAAIVAQLGPVAQQVLAQTAATSASEIAAASARAAKQAKTLARMSRSKLAIIVSRHDL